MENSLRVINEGNDGHISRKLRTLLILNLKFLASPIFLMKTPTLKSMKCPPNLPTGKTQHSFGPLG